MKRLLVTAVGVWVIIQSGAWASGADWRESFLTTVPRIEANGAQFLAITQPIANALATADPVKTDTATSASEVPYQNVILYGVGALAVLLALRRATPRHKSPGPPRES